MRDQILFLLQKAGPHRACTLGMMVGIPTGEATKTLRALEREGLVRSEQHGHQLKWAAVPSVQPPQSIGSADPSRQPEGAGPASL